MSKQASEPVETTEDKITEVATEVVDHTSCEQEIAKWKEGYARALADYQNLERRVAHQQASLREGAAEKTVLTLLPAIDMLEKATEHINDPGLTLVVKQFATSLAKIGVQRIEVLDRQFDPQEMECIEVVPGGKKENVVKELEAGYMLNSRILRPAKVQVAGGRDVSPDDTEQPA